MLFGHTGFDLPVEKEGVETFDGSEALIAIVALVLPSARFAVDCFASSLFDWRDMVAIGTSNSNFLYILAFRLFFTKLVSDLFIRGKQIFFVCCRGIFDGLGSLALVLLLLGNKFICLF